MSIGCLFHKFTTKICNVRIARKLRREQKLNFEPTYFTFTKRSLSVRLRNVS